MLQAVEQAYMQIYADLPEQADVRSFAIHKNKTPKTMEVTLNVSVLQSIAQRGEIAGAPVVFE